MLQQISKQQCGIGRNLHGNQLAILFNSGVKLIKFLHKKAVVVGVCGYVLGQADIAGQDGLLYSLVSNQAAVKADTAVIVGQTAVRHKGMNLKGIDKNYIACLRLKTRAVDADFRSSLADKQNFDIIMIMRSGWETGFVVADGDGYRLVTGFERILKHQNPPCVDFIIDQIFQNGNKKMALSCYQDSAIEIMRIC